ncbi:pyroglutamyl-peptidase I [Rhabdochromatium marinum]|uniref:pyroglutamyl-peptidase I n=1 Tax=Rhabdochromatium marinum TaxID=48729 RepID=UPI001904C7B7|nr:pyroglutamyl-peptidase I [Rhabdochromatium marinum]MBK1648389.1 pyroglutamyl-peptidase I [Rhabdochromatium marinum]
MSTILLTGFEPYGDTPINPAERVARALHGRLIDEARVESRIVPNSFFVCIDVVREAIAELHPDVVVMLGEYPGRSMVTVERIAQNLNDGTRYGLLDNAGRAMQGEMTVPDGPAAYYSTLPIRAMVKAMRAAGVPADISDSAGTFCCNHLMYGVLHHLSLPVEGTKIRAGWIHLPQLPEVAARPENLGVPSMSGETAATGVEAALAAIRRNPADIDEPSISRLLL